MQKLNKATAAAAAVVLLGGSAFALGSITSADAGAPAVTKAQVKKIAKKEIKKAAPTLTVAHASSADTATTAGSAATAGKVGNSSVVSFGVDIVNGGPAVVLGTVGTLTLTGSCPAGVPTIVASAPNGKIRFVNVNNSSVVTANGQSAVTPTGITVNNTADPLGSGSLSYKSTANEAVSAWFGYRNDAAVCNLFGNMLGS